MSYPHVRHRESTAAARATYQRPTGRATMQRGNTVARNRTTKNVGCSISNCRVVWRIGPNHCALHQEIPQKLTLAPRLVGAIADADVAMRTVRTPG
jgi:hypothetical protein